MTSRRIDEPDTHAGTAALLSRLAVGQGVQPSAVDGVVLIRSDRPLPRQPVLYAPCVVVVTQGRKRGYLGGRSFTYDPDHYLVLTAPLPVQVRTDVADDGRPADARVQGAN